MEGDNPVPSVCEPLRFVIKESGCLGLQPKIGGKFHLKLNNGARPIANKYREGKMKSTLEKGEKYVKPLKGKRLKSAFVLSVISRQDFFAVHLLFEQVNISFYYVKKGLILLAK